MMTQPIFLLTGPGMEEKKHQQLNERRKLDE